MRACELKSLKSHYNHRHRKFIVVNFFYRNLSQFLYSKEQLSNDFFSLPRTQTLEYSPFTHSFTSHDDELEFPSPFHRHMRIFLFYFLCLTLTDKERKYASSSIVKDPYLAKANSNRAACVCCR
jgi:hypothetical protein